MSTGELLHIEPQELQFPFTIQAQKQMPPDKQCKDKFLLQSVVASPGATAKDVTAEMAPRSSLEQVDLPEDLSEIRALIPKLVEEKKSAIQQNNRLQKELELLWRETSKSRGGIPFVYLVLIGIIGIILGFNLKKT